MKGQEDKKRANFFMVSNQIVKSGLWAKMKPSERAVYQVLCYFAHPNSGLAYPSIEKISELSGCNKGTVCAATKQLCVYGLISKKLARMKLRFRMTYRILKEPEIDPVTIPWKMEKYKHKKDKKTGKFIRIPSNTESDTIPCNTESDTIPSRTEQNKTYPDISILALKKETSQIHLEKKKKTGFKEKLEEEMDKATSCGEKEFEAVIREIEEKIK